MSENYDFDFALGQLINALKFANIDAFTFKDKKRVKEYIKEAEIWMKEIKDMLNKASKECDSDNARTIK